jgi:hypothetical protein
VSLSLPINVIQVLPFGVAGSTALKCARQDARKSDLGLKFCRDGNVESRLHLLSVNFKDFPITEYIDNGVAIDNTKIMLLAEDGTRNVETQ